MNIDLKTITRFELIDHSRGENARVWVGGPPYDEAPVEIEASVQDDGRTLKLFVKRRPVTAVA